ncbi:hypothetical protein [Streptomyces tailanensis]|uniref:hypothetical protein n=1 Tax=Streptomyces tailanensis TaxID=2569858 RepID=UPI00122E971E|nr:hypothetical protein [Streptomyces tailanensis]
MSGPAVVCALVAAVLFAVLPVVPFADVPARAAEKPTVTLSKSQSGAGGSITVTGSGWRSEALLMILVCGQAEPSRGVPGGTDSCANADGRAVTADDEGDFSRKLPVAEPPVPCPCVVHVATITGEKAEAFAVFQVAGHSVEPLPQEATGGRLSVLTDTRLNGSSGLLTWFGAPPARELVFTVGNVGTSPVENPVFQVGTSHGVFAPQWQEHQWNGTIQPGRKARITLPVELAAGAHGDYSVSLTYGGKVLAEHPWGVGRPWGVTLFWLMLCVVVPAALFRIGMAVVDRVRPGGTTPSRRSGRRLPELAFRLPLLGTSNGAHSRTTPSTTARTTPTLPWFTPDTDPGATASGQLSAPQHPPEESPTTPTTETSQTSRIRKGST